MFVPQSTQTPSELAAPTEDRARLYALLANSWCHPEMALVHALVGREGCELVPAPGEGFSESVNASIRGLTQACSRFREQPEPEVLTKLRTDHSRLFGHAVRGSCPPYELEYGRSEIIQQTAELADLSGFYNAFGLDLRDSAFERGDHIAVECEFLSVLCAKQAWALRNGQSQMAETCMDARRLFLRDHLARWSPAFVHRVKDADPDGFYGLVASLTSALMEQECQSFDIPVGPQWLELRPADPEQDAAIDCDTTGCKVATADQLVQLGLGNLAPTGSAA